MVAGTTRWASKDQLIFLEIDYMKVDTARGMNISVVTTAGSDEEGRKLLPVDGDAVPAELGGQIMATTAKVVKELKAPKFKVRLRNRCRLCGRPRGYLRKFALCRLCFRRLALEGEVAGVIKSSW